MLKSIFIILIALFVNDFIAQEKTNIYLFPGQGSDCRIFSKLKFDTTKYFVNCFDYGTPSADESLSDFALRLSYEIDTTNPFVLIGVSLGGMFCTEIAHVLNPEKTITISSAKTSNELPAKYTIQKNIKLYKVIPDNWYKKAALFLQPIVEPDRNNEEETFVSMLKQKSPTYFKRTVKMLIDWDRIVCSEKVIHIHGSKDNTIPVGGVSATYVVEEGSHMMTLTMAEDINTLLNKILE